MPRADHAAGRVPGGAHRPPGRARRRADRPARGGLRIGNVRAVTKLLDLGAAIAGNGDSSPLDEALYFGQEEVLAILLGRGAVVGNLRTAAGVGDLEKVARCFDEAGGLTDAAGEIAWPFGNVLDAIPADVRRDRGQRLGNALVYAASWGRIAVAECLLKRGAEVNRIPAGFDYAGTPLHYAAFGGRREMVDLLLREGADPAVRDARIGKLPGRLGRTQRKRRPRRAPPEGPRTRRVTRVLDQRGVLLPNRRRGDDRHPHEEAGAQTE